MSEEEKHKLKDIAIRPINRSLNEIGLKKNTYRLLQENEFTLLAEHFGIEISHLKCLVHTAFHSSYCV